MDAHTHVHSLTCNRVTGVDGIPTGPAAADDEALISATVTVGDERDETRRWSSIVIVVCRGVRARL